ncbi:VWA containing CoxE family protein [Vulcanisaeta moutnovskia 768-28]|uniref:VWA containing CoxE family protein n=1 Tax=Vulcanisaeta moutnovskia (strain 768-28) TaxID=985053 RepID=F0QVF9_VULM7|nr:VWA containing CoxE family protein [Vulcanisaeta moutnovskia]ADY02061.1 VWA containing CoxE family protein [Vulcanisaeta moutnovskia 768-28]
MPGILANVDYEEPLTRYRIREVLIEARKRSISYIDKMKQEVLADSFYVHYRQPIMRMPVENEDMEASLWRFVVSTYIRSETYNDVSRITRLNGRLSRVMAIKLLKVYNSILSKMDRNEAFRQMVESAMDRRNSSSRESRMNLEREVRSLINFYVGSMKKVSETVNKVKMLFGDSVGHEIADILLSTDIDPYRLRLISMLNSLIKLIVDTKYTVDTVDDTDAERVGTIGGVKRMTKASELKDMIPSERMLMKFAKPVFAYRLAMGNVLVRERRAIKKPKIYMLIDKSGSMFYTVNVNIFEVGAISKITWATALAVILAMKGGSLAVRFFDQQAYPILTNKKDVIRMLLSLIPLGGTDISNAVRVSVQDALDKSSLREYKLVVITDGEDDNVDPTVFNRAKSVFKSVKALLIGGENSIIEENVDTIKIQELTSESLSHTIKKI